MKLQKTINVMKRNFATHADYRESGTRNGGLIPPHRRRARKGELGWYKVKHSGRGKVAQRAQGGSETRPYELPRFKVYANRGERRVATPLLGLRFVVGGLFGRFRFLPGGIGVEGFHGFDAFGGAFA